MKKSNLYYLIFVLSALFLSSCSSSKYIPEGDYLLHKNKIIFKDKAARTEPLEDYLLQKPTPKTLGLFYTNVGIHYRLNNKESDFNKWLSRVFGREPQILDKDLAEESARNMKSFLHNLAFFDAEIDINYKTRKKKANVEYIVNSKSPYLIADYSFSSPDTAILKLIRQANSESLIKLNKPYNAYQLDYERDRITELLRTNGYYRFNKNFISYTIDSTFNNRSLSIKAEISLPTLLNNENKLQKAHSQHYIRNIFVYPNYDPLHFYDYEPDTLTVSIPSLKDEEIMDNYHFVYYNSLKIRPKVIARSIFLGNNSLFNVEEFKRTYQKLNRFPIFKYVNISFDQDSSNLKPESLPLDVYIRLSRSKTQNYTLETDVTNTSGDLGLRGNLVYSNRNLFRGGELFSLRFTTALEKRSYSSYENSLNYLLFNTIEYGLYFSLRSPNFIIPVKQPRFPKYLAPRSILQLSYNFQTRPSYQRHLGNTSFGYEWNIGNNSLHRLFPIDLSMIKIFPSPEFQANLDTLTNIRYKDQYTDHLIASMKYNLTYNTQKANTWTDFKYFLLRLEIAGNLASLVNDLSSAKPSVDGYYTLFGIRYSQYFRGEFDFRQFHAFNNKQGIIYRAIVGMGIPYGNSSALPFEKGFYGGGANGMRGWAYRNLGPGAYASGGLNEFDKMGEIKLEASIEYRFPIIWYLNGALFTDIGNVWLLKENELFPDGHFKWNSFAKQFGIDGGVGLRFDFEFFIVRLDAAVKFVNPALPEGNRFVLNKTKFSDIFWNFGIGYPF